ncbi:hypothetical protein HDU67_002008 [Dinochytrium kinnereticum]|nr:hypothetical protein HDU67_002008 [Dinochytrium kinnereticum]
MVQILNDFRDDVRIYRLQEATEVPEGLCVLHEHGGHYSLQVAKEMTLEDFNGRLTKFLEGLPSQSREEFLEFFYDDDDQDN